MPGEQAQRVGLLIGQRGRAEIARASRQAPDPFGGRDRFPAHAGGPEHRVGLALEAQRQDTRVAPGLESLAGGGQAHAHIAARQLEIGVGAAVPDGDQHPVGAARHLDVDGPVARPGQSGGLGVEGQRRQNQRILVRVVDLDVAALGGHDQSRGQGHFQAGGAGPHRQRMGVKDRGLRIEDQRRVPLVGLGRGALHRRRAHRRARDGHVATAWAGEIGAGAGLDRLRKGFGADQEGDQSGDAAGVQELHVRFSFRPGEVLDPRSY